MEQYSKSLGLLLPCCQGAVRVYVMLQVGAC